MGVIDKTGVLRKEWILTASCLGLLGSCVPVFPLSESVTAAHIDGREVVLQVALPKREARRLLGSPDDWFVAARSGKGESSMSGGIFLADPEVVFRGPLGVVRDGLVFEMRLRLHRNEKYLPQKFDRIEVTTAAAPYFGVSRLFVLCGPWHLPQPGET